MTRGLDHIVHAVRDLDAVAEAYTRLGFTVGARNKHSWGTHNRIVQFNDSYIELLEVGEPEKIQPHAPRWFSFGAFHSDFLARGQGLDMVLLQSRDAEADAADFLANGVGDFEVFNFERQGQRPDGSIVKLAFSLVFAVDPKAPEVGFGTCQHFYPENFWNPAFQRHGNGVKRIAGVVLVAEMPEQHRKFLLAYTGADSARNTDDGFTVDLPNGTIEMMAPTAFSGRFGQQAPDTSHGARFAAIRFAGKEIGATDKRPQGVVGAVLVFEPPR